MTTTPESILARFAAEYAEHGPGPNQRLVLTFSDGRCQNGYIDHHGSRWKLDYPDGSGWRFFDPARIARIEQGNARHTGAQSLWEREG